MIWGRYSRKADKFTHGGKWHFPIQNVYENFKSTVYIWYQNISDLIL